MPTGVVGVEFYVGGAGIAGDVLCREYEFKCLWDVRLWALVLYETMSSNQSLGIHSAFSKGNGYAGHSSVCQAWEGGSRMIRSVATLRV